MRTKGSQKNATTEGDTSTGRQTTRRTTHRTQPVPIEKTNRRRQQQTTTISSRNNDSQSNAATNTGKVGTRVKKKEGNLTNNNLSLQGKRRSVVVSGLIKDFAKTKVRKLATETTLPNVELNKSAQPTTPNEISTRLSPALNQLRSSSRIRYRARTLDNGGSRCRFRRAKVLLLVDGDLTSLGSISSTPSSECNHSTHTTNSFSSKEDEKLNTEILENQSVAEFQEPSVKFMGTAPIILNAKTDIAGDHVHLNETENALRSSGDIRDYSALSQRSCASGNRGKSSLENTGYNEDLTGDLNKPTSDDQKGDENVSKLGTDNDVDESVPVKVIDTSLIFESESEDDDDESMALGRISTIERCIPNQKGRDTPLDDRVLCLLKKHTENIINRYKLSKIGLYRCDSLIDDEIENLILRISRAAHEQTKNQMILMAGNDIEYERALYNDCLNEEEDLYFRRECLGIIVSECQKEFLQLYPDDKKDKCVDKKMLDWLKRSFGLHKKGTSNGVIGRNALNRELASDGSDRIKYLDRSSQLVHSRRYTRTMAHAAKKSNEENGLDALCSAVDDLESQFGPFPTFDHSKKFMPRNGLDIKRVKQILDDEEATVSVKNSSRLKVDSTETLCKDRGQTNESTRTKNEIMCPSLRELDFLWKKKAREATKHDNVFTRKRKRLETYDDYQIRQSVKLPQTLTDAGIVHRLPRWKDFICNEKQNSHGQEMHTLSSLCRSSINTQRDVDSKIAGRLSVTNRIFNTCEYFCSDIDKQWYTPNEIKFSLGIMGLPPGTQLSRNSWKKVRKCLHKKPRRFSKKFIVSQREKRNQYRSTIRMLQNNPDLITSIKQFPYDVPSIISVGQSVNAYCKRHRMIQSGSILEYRANSAMYLVQFDDGACGCELCPDTDIACIGPTPILIKAPNVDLQYNRIFDKNGNKGESKSVLESIPRYYSNPDSFDATVVTPLALKDSIAEYEAFLTLIRTIEMAKKRKKDLLSIFDDANTLFVDHLPFGDDTFMPNVVMLSETSVKHIDWLMGNLKRTDNILENSMQYLRTLYGEAYLSFQDTKTSAV